MSIVHKEDSIIELQSRKTLEELGEENRQLMAQITDLQLALVDIFEGVAANG